MSELAHFEESMTRTVVSNAVRTDSVDPSPTAISQVTKQAAMLRDRAGMINLDAAMLHENMLQRQWDSETDEKVKLGLRFLLSELTEDYGLGWSDVARFTRVSVPAVRKWRTGGDISPGRLHALAQLSAFLKMLREQGIEDPAAWLATPISGELDRSVTKASMYADGHAIALLAFADRHINLDQLLERAYVPPEKMSQTADLVPAPDGSLSIVPHGG